MRETCSNLSIIVFLWGFKCKFLIGSSLQTVVDLVCPTTFSVVADPGLTLTRVDWLEPDLTGWDETNLTSTAVSGGEFSIGKQRVTYHQWFGMYNLVLQCSLEFLVVGKYTAYMGILLCNL